METKTSQPTNDGKKEDPQAESSPPVLDRVQGLGAFSVLNEDLILKIFQNFEPSELILLSSLSQIFYTLVNQDFLWKPLCLDKHGGDFHFIGSWKFTTLCHNNKKHPQPPPILNVKGFLSEYLYTRWLYSHASLVQFQVDNGAVKRISSKNMTKEQFTDEFDTEGKIALFTDICESWPAAKTWDPEQLAARFPDVEFSVAHKGKQDIKMKLKEYVHYMKYQMDEVPLYIFDSKYGESAKDLLHDYEIPQYFDEDFLTILGTRRPKYRWFVMGPMRSGSPWHIDPNGTSAWNALLRGRKRWAFYPPGQIPPGVWFKEDGKFKSPYPVEWFMNIYPQLSPEERPIEVTQEAGELIYVPRGWWHAVINLEDTVAVTQNYVNRQNIHDCLEDLLSEDRFEEFEEFGSKLTEKYPEFTTLVKSYEEKYQKDLEMQESKKSFDKLTAVISVCKEHDIPPPETKKQVSSAGSSTNLVFFYDKYVFKFYQPNAENAVSAEESVKREVELLQTLGPHKFVAQLVGSGTINGVNKQDAELVYRYVITVRFGGFALEGAWEHIPRDEFHQIVDYLAATTKKLHMTDTTQLKTLENSWKPFRAFLTTQISNLTKNHEKWSSLSRELQTQVAEYVPKDVDVLLQQEIANNYPPILIHGDLTDENLLGTLVERKVKSKKQRKRQTAPKMKNEDVYVDVDFIDLDDFDNKQWKPLGLIDFGDSMIGSFMYEIIPLFLSIFRCDKEYMKRYLQAYGLERCLKSEQFATLAMQFTLLHACDAMSSAYQFKPSLKRCKTFAELAQELWYIA